VLPHAQVLRLGNPQVAVGNRVQAACPTVRFDPGGKRARDEALDLRLPAEREMRIRAPRFVPLRAAATIGCDDADALPP
jgi:hypothetical protein